MVKKLNFIKILIFIFIFIFSINTILFAELKSTEVLSGDGWRKEGSDWYYDSLTDGIYQIYYNNYPYHFVFKNGKCLNPSGTEKLQDAENLYKGGGVNYAVEDFGVTNYYNTNTVGGHWIQNGDDWTYQLANGSYLTNGTYTIGDKYFAFDFAGKLVYDKSTGYGLDGLENQNESAIMVNEVFNQREKTARAIWDNNDNNTDNTSGSTMKDQINSSGIEPIMAFAAELDGNGGDPLQGAGWQFDLFGICMSNSMENYYGNTTFLANIDSVNWFENLLTKAKYNLDFWKSWIKALREKYHIDIRKFTRKPTMVLKIDENKARVQREEISYIDRFFNYYHVILRTFGIILVAYGILIALCGVIDETGLVNKYLTSILTGGKLNREAIIVGNGNPVAAFRKMYVTVSLLTILFGIACLSPTLQAFIYKGITYIYNFVINILYGATNDIANSDGIHILQ